MKTITAVTVLVLPLLLLGGQETIGYLGVSTHSLSEAMRIALDVDHGVLVEKVHDDSPAAKAGVEVGDVITKIDDDPIKDYKTLKKAVASKPNKRVSVTIFRKGRKLSKPVNLGEREISKVKLEMDIPEIPDLNITVNTEEIERAIEEIKAELEKVKEELEQLKDKY